MLTKAISITLPGGASACLPLVSETHNNNERGMRSLVVEVRDQNHARKLAAALVRTDRRLAGYISIVLRRDGPVLAVNNGVVFPDSGLYAYGILAGKRLVRLQGQRCTFF